MSIKSDRWIRKMAEEHEMISPFEPGQVRYNEHGEKLVSYGTSSYGYDVRCANELRSLPMYIQPSSILRISTSVALLISSVMSVSFRRTHLHWLVRSNISKSPVMY